MLERYENFSELSGVYACVEFPLNTLFNDDTIDLYRALTLDFDVVPVKMPTQLDVLWSIILYTKHFDFFKGLIVDELYAYDYQGGNRDECLESIGTTRVELYTLIKKMFTSHRDFTKSLPDKVASKLLEV